MKTLIPIVALVACIDSTGEPAVETVEQHAGSVCADGPTTYGIDVSRFQGTIDWQKVADSGVKFAYIQISRSLTDVDLKFDYNWRRAKEVGILRGAYQRFRPGQDVLGQADLFLEKLGPPEIGDLPPMLDVEDADGLTATQIANRVRQWMERVEPVAGLKPIIYTGFYFWRDSVGSADFSGHPLWVANYSAECPLVPDAWSRWTIHQYSSTVNIPGITENTVDVNKFNGTYADLQALAAAPVCGDGVCSSVAEDADTCPVECEPCQRIAATAATEDIVEDTSACFRAGGDPQFIRTEAAGSGSSLQWTHATDLATPSNFGLWNLYFAEAGRYRVEAFTPAPYNQSKKTVYDVTHAGGTTPVPIDQSAVDGWQALGEFDFAAGGLGQQIRLNDNTGEANATNTRIVFDALRFTRIGDPVGPGPDDEPDPTDASSSGCSAGTHAGIWTLFALLALRRRRR